MNMKKSNLLNFRAVLIFGIVILATLIGMEFIKAEQSRKGVLSFKTGRSYRSHSIPKFLTALIKSATFVSTSFIALSLSD